MKLLTNAEKKVFAELVTDQTQAEIGVTLGISEKTVKFHATHIYEKLGFRSRISLVINYYDGMARARKAQKKQVVKLAPANYMAELQSMVHDSFVNKAQAANEESI